MGRFNGSAWSTAVPIAFLVLWSSGFVFLKVGLTYSDPLTFLALRYACVIGLLAIASLWSRPSVNVSAAGWLNLAIVGLFLQAGYFSFTYLSLKYGLSAGAVALITSQQPILVGLFAPMVAAEYVGPRRWIG